MKKIVTGGVFAVVFAVMIGLPTNQTRAETALEASIDATRLGDFNIRPKPDKDNTTCPAYKGYYKGSGGGNVKFPKDQVLTDFQRPLFGISVSNAKKTRVVHIPGVARPPKGCKPLPQPTGFYMGVRAPSKYGAAMVVDSLMDPVNGLPHFVAVANKNPADQENYIGKWIISEAWPPAIAHGDPCHDIGCAIDIKLVPDVGKNDPRRKAMWKLIASLFEDDDICYARDEYRDPSAGSNGKHFHITAGYCKTGSNVQKTTGDEGNVVVKPPPPQPHEDTCGNGKREAYEDCDLSAPPGEQYKALFCRSLNTPATKTKYTYGLLKCTAWCAFDEKFCRPAKVK